MKRTRASNAVLVTGVMNTLLERLVAKRVPLFWKGDYIPPRKHSKLIYAMFVVLKHRWVVTVVCVAGDHKRMMVHYDAVEDKVSWDVLPHRPDLPSVSQYHTPNAAQDAFILAIENVMCPFLFRHIAARKLQRAWRLALVDPRYEACRRRLLREFEEMS